MRVYLAEGHTFPVEVPAPPSPRKYWTRRGIAECLVERLAEDAPTLVGIDHGFSFPLRYFETHGLLPDWPRFLDDFSATGRPTTIASATAPSATGRRGSGMPAGDG